MHEGDEFSISSHSHSLAGVPEIHQFGDARHRAADRRLPPHYNAGIEICMCRSGVYRWNIEGRVVQIKPGELSLTLPWQEHSGYDNLLGPGRLNWIVLATPGSAGGLRADNLRGTLGKNTEAIVSTIVENARPFVGPIPRAAEAFDRIRFELERGELGREAMIRSQLSQLLVSIARRTAQPVTEPGSARPDHGRGGGRAGPETEAVPSPVLEILRKVAREPEREWTTADMAAAAKLGITRFTEWCRRATGRSPRWYVLERRLERARSLLADTQRPIIDIGLESGFSSSQHFATAFRKLYGESPSDFRRRQ
jgi:AraC-like DNA-binding protein